MITEKKMGVLLVVDDEPVNISIIAKLFKQEYEILAATNGLEAIDIAEKCSPDLVLLDVMMPEMDGYQVCRQLRKNEATKNIPIIFVTAKRELGEEEFGLNLGAIDYITKPFELSIVRARVRNHIELKQKSDLLESLAALDGLTGVPNRRCFDELLDIEWWRAMRDQTQLSLIMVDVDYFKPLNDNYGHGSGDYCLKRLAAALLSSLNRSSDVAARIGGDEFAVVLPGTDCEGATMVAEKICIHVKALAIPNIYSPVADQVTVSIGCATLIPSPDSSPEKLMKAADRMLYRAKEEGRNRIAVFSGCP